MRSDVLIVAPAPPLNEVPRLLIDNNVFSIPGDIEPQQMSARRSPRY